jgi:hypothetical protein
MARFGHSTCANGGVFVLQAGRSGDHEKNPEKMNENMPYRLILFNSLLLMNTGKTTHVGCSGPGIVGDVGPASDAAQAGQSNQVVNSAGFTLGV